MFKYVMLWLIAVCCIKPVTMAADYRPHVQIICFAEDYKAEYSGVVFKQDDNFYHVLTCAHATMNLDKSKIRLKCLVAPEYNTVISNISLSSDLIRQDSDIDIGLVLIPKIEGIRIRPLELANATLVSGTECLSFGYVGDEYKRNIVSTLSQDGKEVESSTVFYTHHTDNGKPRLMVSGAVIQGMSGGALVYQNHVFGIQSSGDSKRNRLCFCPSDVICSFLGEEYGYGK
jgi:hypothetical protein